MARPDPIYLDYAATTPLDPRVAQTMQEAMLASHANPASQHQGGREARKVLEGAREQIARALGAKTDGMDVDRLIFTSGGTEANNLALLGLAGRQPCRVLASAIEHPSINSAADELLRRGYQVDRIRVDCHGTVDVNNAAELFAQAPRPRLVSVMLVNNETGVIQPIGQLSQLCAEHEVPLHVDCVQAVAHHSFGFRDVPLAAATISAHKFGGPPGIGALLLHADAKIEPQHFGGFQQAGLRPGTESIPLVVGMEAAIAHQVVARDGLPPDRRSFERALREQLDSIVINGEKADRVPHISNVAFVGVDRQQLFLALDFAGVYCSTGSACASGSSEPSPVLRAMGLPEEVISSSLRFSFGTPTALDEVEEATRRIVKCVKQLRSRKSTRK